MAISASDVRQWPPDSFAPASEYWEVVGVDGSYWGRRTELQGGMVRRSQRWVSEEVLFREVIVFVLTVWSAPLGLARPPKSLIAPRRV